MPLSPMKIRSLVFPCVLHKLERSITPLTTRLFASFLVVAALLVLTLSNASAVPLTYQVGNGSSVTLNSAEPGLILAYSPLVTPFSFTLNDNGVQDFDETGIDQISFDFFKIWVTEGTIDPDDFQHRNISASLDLTTLGLSVIPGTAALGNGTFFNFVSVGIERVRFQGNLLWDNPPPTFVASDRTFTIDLSDAIFNAIEDFREAGPLIDAGEEGAAVVRATITQTASSVPSVPDSGSTAILLGLGLLAMACARKRLLPTVKCPFGN
jgi:VPDSG-CTERM motif